MMNKNAKFLAVIDSATRDEILAGIGKHYGLNAKAAYDEVANESAEHLLDYLVEPQRTAASALMQRHGLR